MLPPEPLYTQSQAPHLEVPRVAWDSLGLQAISRLPEELWLMLCLKLLENPPAKETPYFLLVLPAGSALFGSG